MEIEKDGALRERYKANVRKKIMEKQIGVIKSINSSTMQISRLSQALYHEVSSMV